MPHRPCVEARCPEFARPNSSRCDEHAREYERERSRRRREEKGGRPYDRKRYKVARRRVVAQPCQCAGCAACTHLGGGQCGKLAEEADHIKPLEDGGDAFALSNLRGMCRACHVERHR
jgi:5-methylcytosine-specific restriction endonuclease McrA